MRAISFSGAIFPLCYIEHNAGSIFSYFCFNCAQILPLVEAFESIKFDLVRKLSGLITDVLYVSWLLKNQMSASFYTVFQQFLGLLTV